MRGRQYSAAYRIAARDPRINFDPIDEPIMLSRTWRVTSNGYVAAKLNVPATGERPRKVLQVYLHRALMDAPKGMTVDHINGDRLDNRRVNLRIVSTSANSHNKHFPKATVLGVDVVIHDSGTSGVYVDKRNRSRQFIARITVGKKTHHIGAYESAEQAGLALSIARRVFLPELFPDCDCSCHRLSTSVYTATDLNKAVNFFTTAKQQESNL